MLAGVDEVAQVGPGATRVEDSGLSSKEPGFNSHLNARSSFSSTEHEGQGRDCERKLHRDYIAWSIRDGGFNDVHRLNSLVKNT